MSRGGDYIAYGNGLTIYVLEKATGQLRNKAPLIREIESEVTICPMGTFLLYAVNDGSVVRRWNATSKEYQLTPFQPKTPAVSTKHLACRFSRYECKRGRQEPSRLSGSSRMVGDGTEPRHCQARSFFHANRPGICELDIK